MRVFETIREFQASAADAWPLLSDVCNWPSWLPTVSRVLPLDSPQLVSGSRFKIWQPRLLPATWQVTSVRSGFSFTWESRSLGMVTTAEHVISTVGKDRVRVLLRITLAGWLSTVIAGLFGRLTLDYIQREAQALESKVLQGRRSLRP
jgi:uncharacterized membrane protein